MACASRAVSNSQLDDSGFESLAVHQFDYYRPTKYSPRLGCYVYLLRKTAHNDVSGFRMEALTYENI